MSSSTMVNTRPKTPLPTTETRWYAVKTKFKAEKFVCNQLAKRGVTAYIPLQTTTKRYTRKVKHYEKPLIYNYVFVQIDPSQYLKVLETEYVLYFVKQGTNITPIPDEEMTLLKRVVGEIETVQMGPIQYDCGDEVELIAGNLTVLRGTLLERKNIRLFKIELNHIGLELAMELDISLLSLVRKNKSTVNQ